VYCDLEKSWTFVKETEIAAMILAPDFFFVTLDPLKVSCFLCTLSMILPFMSFGFDFKKLVEQ
jgi:hypothetical protein